MQLVNEDRLLVESALAAVSRECDDPDDRQLLDKVARGRRGTRSLLARTDCGDANYR